MTPRKSNKFLQWDYYRTRMNFGFLWRVLLFFWEQLSYLPFYLTQEIRLKLSGAPNSLYLAFNIGHWKRKIVSEMLWQLEPKSTRFVSTAIDRQSVERFLRRKQNPVFLIWGMREADVLLEIAKERNIPVWRIEDGFIRSIGLGAKRILPVSLILDKTGGIYFNSERKSELEDFLNTHQFSDRERSLAKTYMNRILRGRITKYNLREEDGNYSISNQSKNIMVFGQCEDDASIVFGSPDIKLNSELIEKAIEENPGANIYFRPHPDVTAGLRKAFSDVYQYKNQVCIMSEPFPIWEKIDLFETVYVMTSLAGFEAAMRGCHVRVFGQPFYAGWGITDDVNVCHRRGRALKIEEVFFGAYVHVPTYIDPSSGRDSTIDEAINRLQSPEIFR